MAIQHVYGVPVDPLLELAQQTGQGQYDTQQRARQDEIDLARERMAQQGSQFDQELGLREQQLALQDMLNRRGLGAQMYQFNAERQDRAAGKEMDIAAAFQQELMRQQGFTDMRQSQQAMQTEELDARRQNMLTQEQMRTKQHFQDRQFTTAMAAAAQIEKDKATMTPEMYDQARGQWDQVYGEVAGEYPFLAPQIQQGPTDEIIGGIHRGLQSIDPDLFTEEDARGIAELPRGEQVQAKMKLFELKAAATQAKEDSLWKQQLEEMKNEQKSVMDWNNHEQKLVTDAEAFKQKQIEARMKFQNDLRTELLKPVVNKGPLGETSVGLAEPDPAERARIIAEAMAEYDGRAGGETTPQSASSEIPEWTGEPATFMFEGVKYRRTGPGPQDFVVVEAN